MKSSRQARWLVRRIRDAKFALRDVPTVKVEGSVFQDIPADITEDEVLFRFNTIKGLLNILLNDALQMADDWQENETETVSEQPDAQGESAPAA